MNEKEFHDRMFLEEAELFKSPLLHAVRSHVARVLLREISRAAKPVILSLGSGDGFYELAMAGCATEIYGMDISPVATAYAAKRAESLGCCNARFITGDVTRVDQWAGERRFDVICGLATLHHLAEGEMRALLAKCAALLKDGGRFISIDPSRRRLVSLLRFLARGKMQTYHSPLEKELLAEEVTNELRLAGFSNVHTTYVDFFAGPLGWMWPSCPRFVAECLVFADAILCKIPILKRWASSFCCVATISKDRLLRH